MYRGAEPRAPSPVSRGRGLKATGSVRPARGLRGLSLACRGVAIEIAVGLPFGQPSIQDVLDMLHNEVDGHCGTETNQQCQGRTWEGWEPTRGHGSVWVEGLVGAGG